MKDLHVFRTRFKELVLTYYKDMPSLTKLQNECWQIEFEIEKIIKENSLLIEQQKVGSNEINKFWNQIKLQIIKL